MTSLIRSSNKSIHDALRVLARDIQSEDGAANAAIAEAADRIAELGTENEQLHLENTQLKREIEDVKLVRYSIEDALTRSQQEAASTRADKARLDWILTDDGGHWVNWMYEKEEWTPELKASRDAIDACLKPSTWKEAQP